MECIIFLSAASNALDEGLAAAWGGDIIIPGIEAAALGGDCWASAAKVDAVTKTKAEQIRVFIS
jgi:hypothetical protein